MKTESMMAAKAAYDIEAACITEMKEYFDEEQFAKAVELLAKAERIGTTGCGHSGIICQHLAHLLCCIERPAVLFPRRKRCMGRPDFCRRAT